MPSNFGGLGWVLMPTLASNMATSARTRSFYICLAEGDADELCLWGVEMLPHVGVHLTLERAGA